MLGPSGCGKTTTLRMIAGFEQPTGGRILLEGHDVSHIPPYRRNVNTVFQHYALFPHMSVRDNVAFGPRSRGLPKAEIDQRVGELLEVVRLAAYADRRPAQLSGGQQQRVALARALVNYPSALLLDEPLGALDLKLRQAMQIELKRIQREVDITFIYVTHDQEEALTMSDRIAVMNEGRVDQLGAPQVIYHEPDTLFVATFIGVANLLPARSRRGRGRRGDRRDGGQPAAGAPRHPFDARRPGDPGRPAGASDHHEGAARGRDRASGDAREHAVPGPGRALRPRARRRHRDRLPSRPRRSGGRARRRPRLLGELGRRGGAVAAAAAPGGGEVEPPTRPTGPPRTTDFQPEETMSRRDGSGKRKR